MYNLLHRSPLWNWIIRLRIDIYLHYPCNFAYELSSPCMGRPSSSSASLWIRVKRRSCWSSLCWRNVCPSQFPIYRSLLDIVADQKIFKTLLTHLLVNTCKVFSSQDPAFQVSHPYNKIVFTLEIKISILVYLEICVEFQIRLNVLYVR